MRPPYLPNPKQIRTEDLEPLYDYINSLQFHGDGINIVVDHDPTGVSVRFIGDLTPPAESSGGATNTYPAKIINTTSTAGLYFVDLYANGFDESPTHTNVKAIPTINTFTPLSIGDACVVLLDNVETLGDNET